MILGAHHKLAIQWLLEHRQAALFMGMGLGKTACTLTAFDGLRDLGLAKRMLVVAPLRVCNLTWPNEIAKWREFHHLQVVSLRSKQGMQAFRDNEADVYLCNYEMLPKVAEAIEQDGCPFDVIVFDELTKAKSHKSVRINALRKVLPEHIIRWGLTGTPTPNSLLELFAQIRLLDNGQRLGRSYDRYLRTHFYPTDYMEYNWELLPGADKLIQAKISDIALTLLSSEYLNVPDTVHEDIDVALPDEAKAQYRELQKKLVLLLGDELDVDNIVSAQNAAVLTNKLLQICGGAVYKEDGSYVVIHDAKIDALLAYRKKHPEPALIAYNYRHELERLQKAFPDAETFDGKNVAGQQKLERDWNAGKVKNLLVHPASVGHGLNLQFGGAKVIWFSPTWSPEQYDQLNSRVIRPGQTSITTIVRIICSGTMDDAVVESLRDKNAGQAALLRVLTNFRKMLFT